MNTWILSLLGFACSGALPQGSRSKGSAVQSKPIGRVDGNGARGEVPAGAEAWCAPLAVPSSQVLGLGPNDSLGAVQEGRRAGRSGTTAAGSLALPWNSPSRPLWCATRSTPHRRPTLPPSTAVPGALGLPQRSGPLRLGGPRRARTMERLQPLGLWTRPVWVHTWLAALGPSMHWTDPTGS